MNSSLPDIIQSVNVAVCQVDASYDISMVQILESLMIIRNLFVYQLESLK